MNEQLSEMALRDLGNLLQVRQCNLTFAGECVRVIDEVIASRDELRELRAALQKRDQEVAELSEQLKQEIDENVAARNKLADQLHAANNELTAARLERDALKNERTRELTYLVKGLAAVLDLHDDDDQHDALCDLRNWIRSRLKAQSSNETPMRVGWCGDTSGNPSGPLDPPDAEPDWDLICKDAARYEWLRENWRWIVTHQSCGPAGRHVDLIEVCKGIGQDTDPQSLDQAIDAALRSEAEDTKP
jgi:hypothetical protein